MSFIADKIVMDGLTFWRCLVNPRLFWSFTAHCRFNDKVSKTLNSKIPFVTAAMDTVTEAKMAIAIAARGIGVIHKTCR